MQAVERTHHIDLYMFGQGLQEAVEALKNYYPDIEFFDDEEQIIDSEESSVFKQIESEMTAGIRLKIRRENKGMTQQNLSEKTGIAVSNISLMENNKRPIGAKIAKIAEEIWWLVPNSLYCGYEEKIIQSLQRYFQGFEPRCLFRSPADYHQV